MKVLASQEKEKEDSEGESKYDDEILGPKEKEEAFVLRNISAQDSDHDGFFDGSSVLESETSSGPAEDPVPMEFAYRVYGYRVTLYRAVIPIPMKELERPLFDSLELVEPHRTGWLRDMLFLQTKH